MDQAKPHRLSALILPICAVACAMAAFQLGATFAKSLFPAVGAQGAAALRLCLAAPIMLVIMRPWRAWPKPAPLAPLIGLGVAMAGGIEFFYLAIAHLPQGVAVALQFLGPLSVAIFSSKRWSDIVWTGLAAGGVWLLVGAGAVAAKIDLIGVAYALCAAVSWASYILVGRSASKAFGSSTAALALSVAALVLAPVGLIHAGAALFNPALLPMALLVAILAAALPFSLELYALLRIPRRTFAVFTCVEPAFGCLSGFALLHERLSASQMAGVAAVIAAAAGATWASGSAGAANEAATVADAPTV